MRLTNKKFLSILKDNSKENPFNIDKYDKQNIIDTRNRNLSSGKHFFVQFHCKDCNKVVIKDLIHKIRNTINYLSYCQQCKFKHTSLEKYGVDNPTKSIEIQNKIKKTCLKKYGVERYPQTCEWNNKYKETCKKHYGVEHNSQSEEFKQKRRKTWKEKYGVEYISQSEYFKCKSEETSLKKYGEKHYTNREQAKQTCLNKYGTEYAIQSKEISEKMVNTFLNKYGTVCVKSLYAYNNYSFNSYWELCFYIYHYNKKHNIVPQPCKFEYYVNNIKHYYFPDFKVGNKYYEIKGEQFIERYKNGNIKTLKCPFKNGNNTLYKEKYKCMKKHKVKVIDYKLINKYIDYVESKYDKDFLDNLKVNKNNEKD